MPSVMAWAEVVAYSKDGEILVGTTAKRQAWADGRGSQPVPFSVGMLWFVLVCFGKFVDVHQIQFWFWNS